MLGKLLKYEIKATSRILLPLYLVLLAVAVANRFLNPFEMVENIEGFNIQSFINVLSILLYFIMAASVIAGTFIIILQRFYKNLLSDEGYLSFTLPVETHQHILSKTITSIMWVILSIIVIIASILIVADIDNFIREFSKFLEEISTVFGSGIFVMLPIYMLSALLLSILTFYNSISIGHQFQNHKVIASFIMFFAFYILTQTILVILLTAITFNLYGDLFASPFNATTIPNANLFFGIVTVVLLLMAVGHYLSINYFLKNKLNLE